MVRQNKILMVLDKKFSRIIPCLSKRRQDKDMLGVIIRKAPKMPRAWRVLVMKLRVLDGLYMSWYGEPGDARHR